MHDAPIFDALVVLTNSAPHNGSSRRTQTAGKAEKQGGRIILSL